MSLTRDEAIALLEAEGPEPSQRHHALESEAVLRGLAAHLGEDEALWGLTGLLHDLDFVRTRQEPARHGLVGAQMLEDRLPPEALQAIRAHNHEHNGSPPPSSRLDWALRCGETVTGLVSATALVRPTGLQGMKPKSLKKKMKDRAFAANVRRDVIRECEHLGLEIDGFLEIAIQAIAPLAADVGLQRPSGPM